ncbi:hypothetical protein BDF14DRAFT_476963 [Spinellus fusiger]|nr:hypothetical protein BDF14DRAFT_476963 [Spinellus fusiger]
MFLEQSCPGQANLHSHAIHTFIWERHYIVYATGSLVAVYTDPNVLVQNIEEPSEILLEVPSEVSNESRLSSVTAVAGDCKTGRIAVAYTHHIGIFRPQLPASSKTQPLWRVETVISTKSQVSCLDWSINGLLLAAGIDMTLWQESQSNCGEWDVLWTAR